jgi:methyltransferase (TIGR00027 family)
VADAEGPPSPTAIFAAVARAIHAAEAPPRVFEDELAESLAGVEGVAVGEALRDALPPERLATGTRWFAARARYVEDLVSEAARAGTAQYVILGAGLDSFAYRRALPLEGLTVYEVDHPATQSWKRARLQQIGVAIPPRLIFAPVDFEHQSLELRLRAAGFSPTETAVFSWIAVTQYIGRDAIEATLAAVAGCAAGTRIVFSYDLPRHLLSAEEQLEFDFIADYAAQAGEPFVSLFEPAEIDALLQDHGFSDVIHAGRQDVWAMYEALRASAPPRQGIARLVTATVL